MRVLAPSKAHFFHWLKLSGIVLLFLFAGALLLLALKWPFRRAETVQSLERISACNVQIAGFQEIFFPHAGYIARDVVFKRGENSGSRPLAKIARIICRASWFSLLSFTHRISRMELEGLELYIPAHIPPPVHKHPEAKIKTTVTELNANGTVLQIEPRHPGETLRFQFAELNLKNLARNKPIQFRVDFKNPNPAGEIKTSGTLGPLTLGNVAQTPVSGSFRLTDADLSCYKVILGDLSADGRFDGKLGHANVDGRAVIPNFEVRTSRHSLGLSAEYRATVNGTNGDVLLEFAQAHFLETTLNARGSITGEPSKTVALDFDARRGQVQDLLRFFVRSDRPPLDGPITLRAHVVLPPGHRPFIRRVQLDGVFSIDQAEFTNARTQEKVNELSARARGEKWQMKRDRGAERVPDDFKGDVKLRDATATLASASFAVPGAIARGAGTYNVETQAIDLRGKVDMQASLSKAASGLKSFFLVPLDPFFKKNGAGAVLPVHLTGTYSHPVFRVSLRR